MPPESVIAMKWEKIAKYEKEVKKINCQLSKLKHKKYMTNKSDERAGIEKSINLLLARLNEINNELQAIDSTCKIIKLFNGSFDVSYPEKLQPLREF